MLNPLAQMKFETTFVRVALARARSVRTERRSDVSRQKSDEETAIEAPPPIETPTSAQVKANKSLIYANDSSASARE